MRIDRIEASKHKRGRVLVFLADGSLLKVTEQELLTFGLRSGDELDEETLTRLKEAAGAGRPSSAPPAPTARIVRSCWTRSIVGSPLPVPGIWRAPTRIFWTAPR